jgi:hypothetical protein
MNCACFSFSFSFVCYMLLVISCIFQMTYSNFIENIKKIQILNKNFKAEYDVNGNILTY